MESVLVAQVRLSAWLIKRNYFSFIAFRLEKRSSTAQNTETQGIYQDLLKMKHGIDRCQSLETNGADSTIATFSLGHYIPKQLMSAPTTY